ncbi:MAG: metallophosphoesterase family protein [Anaerolineae bacterium]|nr:metallophosphatase family protein [Anaerolineae bacterium]MDW8298506.1 metallophosphoesterase family protein [Anaerolineae bacterium]
MRLAMLSDIHGNLHALEAVLADLKAYAAPDQIWVLGDLCLMGAHPAECLQRIRDLPNVKVISGNTDRRLVTGQRGAVRPKNAEEWASFAEWLTQRDQCHNWTVSCLSYADFEYLINLPAEIELHVPNYGWLLGYHGAPGNDEANLLPDTPADEVLDHFLDREGRFGVGGHTHIPMDRELGMWRVVNVGSVGMPKDDPRPCYAIATFENGTAHVEIRRVTYDIEAMLRALEQSSNPAWQWAAENFKRT